MNLYIMISNIVTAFERVSVGSKVLVQDAFFFMLKEAIAAYDWDSAAVPGVAVIQLGPDANVLVSAGVGPRSPSRYDYVLREHRGRVEAFLHRDNAAPTESVAVVVYTVAAYLTDPDVDEAERQRCRDFALVSDLGVKRATHVVVGVLASAGPTSPRTPHRLLAGLAGHNQEAMSWGVDEIRAHATLSLEYDKQWCVVAD